MPKVRFRDFYQYPESFEDITEDILEDSSLTRTQPFFRNKRLKTQRRPDRNRKSRHRDDEDL